jgi:hypothetical protein
MHGIPKLASLRRRITATVVDEADANGGVCRRAGDKLRIRISRQAGRR